MSENRNLWQCVNLFRHTCPHHKDPAMKSVVTLVQEMFNEVAIEAIETAEALCEECPHFEPEPDFI